MMALASATESSPSNPSKRTPAVSFVTAGDLRLAVTTRRDLLARIATILSKELCVVYQKSLPLTRGKNNKVFRFTFPGYFAFSITYALDEAGVVAGVDVPAIGRHVLGTAYRIITMIYEKRLADLFQRLGLEFAIPALPTALCRRVVIACRTHCKVDDTVNRRRANRSACVQEDVRTSPSSRSGHGTRSRLRSS